MGFSGWKRMNGARVMLRMDGPTRTIVRYSSILARVHRTPLIGVDHGRRDARPRYGASPFHRNLRDADRAADPGAQRQRVIDSIAQPPGPAKRRPDRTRRR